MITVNGTLQNTDFLFVPLILTESLIGEGSYIVESNGINGPITPLNPFFVDEFEFSINEEDVESRRFEINSDDLDGQAVSYAVVNTRNGEFLDVGQSNPSPFIGEIDIVDGFGEFIIPPGALEARETYRLILIGPSASESLRPDFDQSFDYQLSSPDTFEKFIQIDYFLSQGITGNNAVSINGRLDKNDNYLVSPGQRIIETEFNLIEAAPLLSFATVYAADQFRVNFSPNDQVETQEIVIQAEINADPAFNDYPPTLPIFTVKNAITGEFIISSEDFGGGNTIITTPDNGGNRYTVNFVISEDDTFLNVEIEDLLRDGIIITGTNPFFNQNDVMDLILRSETISPADILMAETNTPFEPFDYTFTVSAQGQKLTIDELLRTRELIPSNETETFDFFTLDENSAQLAYVAYYGRPGDPAGLDFWNGVIGDANLNYSPKNGDILEGDDLIAYNAIINGTGNTLGFGNSDEANRLFGDVLNEMTINQIYRFAFNRDADSNGLTFWNNAIESGDITLANAALEIALGAEGLDLLTLQNKIESADIFTNALDTPQRVSAYAGLDAEQTGRDFLADFGSDIATVNEANSTINTLL